MTTTTPSPDVEHGLGVDLSHDSAAYPEAIARVTATAADLVAQGRRVTMRELSRLTGLEPPAVAASVDTLVLRGMLQPAGVTPHHYVFARGRWPLA